MWKEWKDREIRLSRDGSNKMCVWDYQIISVYIKMIWQENVRIKKQVK